MSAVQLAIIYSPTGEIVRLIDYGSRTTASRESRRAMNWLNPDRFHTVILEGRDKYDVGQVPRGVPPTGLKP